MNSMSRTHYQNDNDPCPKKHSHEEEFEPCPKPNREKCLTILKCGCPSSVTIPAATVAGTAFTLTSLALNTSCLCEPCVKLEFTSNPVATVAFTGTLNFQVFKQCNNQFTPVPIGPSFTFSETALLFASTFSFFVCDCDSCFNDCCTYTVVATVTSAVTVGTLSINNNTLAAIATDNNCRCC